MEKDDHDQHDHDRIEKLECGGHAAGQVAEGPEEKQGGQHVHDAQARQLAEVHAARAKTFAARGQQAPERDGGNAETVKQDGFRRYARMQQRQGEEGNKPERG